MLKVEGEGKHFSHEGSFFCLTAVWTVRFVAVAVDSLVQRFTTGYFAAAAVKQVGRQGKAVN